MSAVIGLTGLIGFAVTAFAGPQAGEPSDSAAMTQRQAEEVWRQLQVIRHLLEMQGLAKPVETKVRDTGYALGQKDAPVTLVEFSDYQCPYCVQFQNETFEKLRQNFVQTGKVRIVMRDLPLARHADALKAAEAARCGGDQGKFWEFRSVLATHPQDLSPESLFAYARQMGLDMGRFEQCLDRERFLPEIQQDEADAQAAGITATPSFVLGKADKGVVNGVRLVGVMPYSAFSEWIMKQLATPSRPAGSAVEVVAERP